MSATSQPLVRHIPNSVNVEDSAHGVAPVKAMAHKPMWPEFVAGGAGGMTAALLTSPLDVVRTRLQSDFYRTQLTVAANRSDMAASRRFRFLRSSIRHFGETFHLLSSIYRVEGWRTLFKGLGPNLAGVVPSSAIKFYTYTNSKRIISQEMFSGHETPLVHLFAAASAGIATSTATNPIWLVKTRLQLDKSLAVKEGSIGSRRYKGVFDCIAQVIQQEGVRGLYRGLTASYLGVTESALHWVLYEQLKQNIQKYQEYSRASHEQTLIERHVIDIVGRVTAAGLSKVVAILITYPHEVVRTRLRQAPMSDGRLKYTGIFQCFHTICMQEGLVALYGGLTPHLLRAVPSTAIMFGVYEAVIKFLATR